MSRKALSMVRGLAVVSVLVASSLAGAFFLSNLAGAQSSTSPTVNSPATVSQSTSFPIPSSVSQGCTLPAVSANSSIGVSMTLTSPHCNYYVAPTLDGGTVGMVLNESFDVAISGPVSTAVSLVIPKTPFGAAWFASGSNVTTNSIGSAQTVLYLAGMWVNTEVTSNHTVTMEAIAPGGLGVSLNLGVVQSSTLTGLDPTRPIIFPSFLLVEPANFSQGTSYRVPFTVVYLPSSTSPATLNLSLSVIGLASGNQTVPGKIQPMPPGLNVWFADGQGNKETSLTLSPRQIQVLFLSGDTTSSDPIGYLKVYNVAIQVTESGSSFTEVVRVAIESPTPTK
jgi:hypothetical protein